MIYTKEQHEQASLVYTLTSVLTEKMLKKIADKKLVDAENVDILGMMVGELLELSGFYKQSQLDKLEKWQIDIWCADK